MCRPRPGGEKETARFGRCPSVPGVGRGAPSTSVPPAADPLPVPVRHRRAGSTRRGRGGRTGGSPPARPPAPPRHSRKADAPSPTRRPLAPFLSVTSYIITRANQNGSDARCRGPVPGRHWVLAPRAPGPRTRRRSARLRGKGQSAASARPSSEKALPLPVPVRKPRASQTASASSNTFHGPPPAGEPAAGAAGPRPGLAGAPPGRRKFLGALPAPALRPAPPRLRPLAAQPAPMAGWATCDPRARGGPLPAGPAPRRSGASPQRGGTRRRQKLPRAAPRGAAARVPAHRPYLALGRPRAGRAARGAWSASARAWGGSRGRPRRRGRGGAAGCGRGGGGAAGRAGARRAEPAAAAGAGRARRGGGGVAVGLFTHCCPARGTARTP